MATTGTANSQGALLELVARGNKDSFFFQDDPQSIFIFQNNYKPHVPQIEELRYDQPLTAVQFGRTCEFQFVIVGDLFRAPTLIIDLPTWLPPPIALLNPRAVITDTSGVSYGYTDSVGYFLFERIQLYQDNFVIQEWSGDALWALAKLSGTKSSSTVADTLIGAHDSSLLAIQRAATPLQLRLPLPIIGTQSAADNGFPQRCCTGQAFRLKLKLRRLEDLVVASDRRQKPAPWGRSDFYYKTSASMSPIPFQTLQRTEIPPPQIQLETTQVYLLAPYQTSLLATPHRIPFTQLYENKFTQNSQDYAATALGGASVINRRIDYTRHPTGRILWFFRSRTDILANYYSSTRNASAADGSYITAASLFIAGQQRELPRSERVWRDIVQHAKEEIDTDANTHIGVIDFTRGSTYSTRRDQELATPTKTTRQPDGSVNMTTADRPTLQFTLAPTTPYDTELLVITEGWAEYRIDPNSGRGYLLSAN
jgi:hypothetical protein